MKPWYALGAVAILGGAALAASKMAKANTTPTPKPNPPLPNVPQVSPGSIVNQYPPIGTPPPGPPVPLGWAQARPTIGLHGEDGMLFTYPNGDQWFMPFNPLLVPYHVPGGSKDFP